jgi:hypothetical protein
MAVADGQFQTSSFPALNPPRTARRRQILSHEVKKKKERRKISAALSVTGNRMLDIYAPMMPSFGSCAIRRMGEIGMCLVGPRKKKWWWV